MSYISSIDLVLYRLEDWRVSENIGFYKLFSRNINAITVFKKSASFTVSVCVYEVRVFLPSTRVASGWSI